MFSIKNFFSKCDQILSFLQILLHILKKSLMNFIFCAVTACSSLLHSLIIMGQDHFLAYKLIFFRSSPPEVFLGKGVLKICSKFTGEHPGWKAISIKLQSHFIEIKLRHGCSPVNLLHIFRTPFSKNTSGGLLLIHGITIAEKSLQKYSSLANRGWVAIIQKYCTKNEVFY